MNLSVFIASVLFATSPVVAADPKISFPEQVKKLLSSDWTELTVSTALVTDYGVVYGIGIHLRRDAASVPPLAADATTPHGHKRLSAANWKLLSDAIAGAAQTTFKHKYPLEILDSVTPEKAEEMLKSGKLNLRPTDVEMFHLKAKTPNGEVILDESGPYQPLDQIIGQLLKSKARELKSSEIKIILGRNPYE